MRYITKQAWDRTSIRYRPNPVQHVFNVLGTENFSSQKIYYILWSTGRFQLLSVKPVIDGICQ